MTPKPVSFRQIDAPPNEAKSEVPRRVQIIDTYGFEIIEQTTPVAPANSDVRAVSLEQLDVVPFAATLRRIA
jgi:hypothetical protein